MDARSQIDFLWQFFVTVHFAIFALLFIYDHAVAGLNGIGKLFSVAGIAVFKWINGSALINAYFTLIPCTNSIAGHTRFYVYGGFVLADFSNRADMVLHPHHRPRRRPAGLRLPPLHSQPRRRPRPRQEEPRGNA
jgi:hypothetical protein